MAKPKVVWTETAAKQRREILKYWTERNQSTNYAEKLIEVTAKHLKVITQCTKLRRRSNCVGNRFDGNEISVKASLRQGLEMNL